MPLTLAEVALLSGLVEKALTIDPDHWEAWLATLSPDQQALVPHLRRLLVMGPCWRPPPPPGAAPASGCGPGL